MPLNLSVSYQTPLTNWCWKTKKPADEWREELAGFASSSAHRINEMKKNVVHNYGKQEHSDIGTESN